MRPNGHPHEDTDDLLLWTIDTLGPLPPKLQQAWPRYARYFDAAGVCIRHDVGRNDIFVPAVKYLPPLRTRLLIVKQSLAGLVSDGDMVQLQSLLRMLLCYEQEKPLQASAVLRAPFFESRA